MSSFTWSPAWSVSVTAVSASVVSSTWLPVTFATSSVLPAAAPLVTESDAPMKSPGGGAGQVHRGAVDALHRRVVLHPSRGDGRIAALVARHRPEVVDVAAVEGLDATLHRGEGTAGERCVIHQPRSGKPCLVASCSTVRCSSPRPVYGSPLPPGPSCRRRPAANRPARVTPSLPTVMLLGIELVFPCTIWMPPSHTPSVFSIAAIVWYAPPLPPKR